MIIPALVPAFTSIIGMKDNGVLGIWEVEVIDPIRAPSTVSATSEEVTVTKYVCQAVLVTPLSTVPWVAPALDATQLRNTWFVVAKER